MKPHNSHVLKWYRWKIWLAKGRPLALTFLIEWHNQEFAYSENEAIP